ncbi:tail fiber domain-containing protein [Escherichia coli]|nr:tail fiber domain-containing protein [Escherichia coli]
MIYSTGTISINGNTATGSGTNWTAPASQVRAGQTIIVMSNPVQMFQISSVNSATSMTITPAASPALSGQKYGILVSDNISVDGLAQAMSQLIKEYDENIGAWETFATTSANQSITVTINGTAVTIPGIGKLAQKGSNGAVTVADGGTGATNAADARTKLGLGSSDSVAFKTITASGRVETSVGNPGFQISTAANQSGFVRHMVDGVSHWYVGKGDPSSDNIYFSLQKIGNFISLGSDGGINLYSQAASKPVNISSPTVNINASSGPSLSLSNTGTASSNLVTRLWGQSSRPTVIEYGTPNGYIFYAQENTDGSRVVNVNGTIVASNVTGSDRDLKDKIEPITNALEKIGKINGCTYVMKDTLMPDAGVIAQEILEVLPEAVSSFVKLPEGVELGSLSADEENKYRFYAVNYDAVTGLAIQAIKELSIQLNQLNNDINDLRNQTISYSDEEDKNS